MNHDQDETPPLGWTEAELDLTTLDEALLPEGHRSGFVAVAGRPNVGKSTLMNAFLGQKVAIVSPKPQTTRLRQLGILTLPDYQIVFVDTPGWHEPQHKLGEYMVRTAAAAVADADLILFLVDVSESPTPSDMELAELIKGSADQTSVILVMNKTDLLGPAMVRKQSDVYRDLLPQAEWILVSATRGDNRDALLGRIIEALPEGPRYYPSDQITDSRVRDIASELIREKALGLLRQEVPHAIAVVIDEFKERSEDLVYVKANIYVERDSQKRIVIGRNGDMLKRIGSAARQEIERVLETKVFLDLWVKVRPKWRQNEITLRHLGYTLRD